MRQAKFTESQICNILKQQESGMKVSDICREHGIAESTFYKWRKQYAGMDATLIKQMKELKEENARLKRMFADAKMDNEIMKEALEKKW